MRSKRLFVVPQGDRTSLSLGSRFRGNDDLVFVGGRSRLVGKSTRQPAYSTSSPIADYH
jgi:hypothetical protein